MWVHPVKAYRAKHGLTLAAFGTKVDRTAGEVHKWEAGRMPRRDLRLRIHKATSGQVPWSAAAWEPPLHVAEKRRNGAARARSDRAGLRA